jgi:anti-anti-sigma factor
MTIKRLAGCVILVQPVTKTVRLQGEIDLCRRETLRRALERLEDADLAIVNLSRVTYFDLTLVNGLVHLKNHMSFRSKTSTVRLVGAPPILATILKIIELSSMFDLRPRQSELAHFRRQRRAARGTQQRVGLLG